MTGNTFRKNFYQRANMEGKDVVHSQRQDMGLKIIAAALLLLSAYMMFLCGNGNGKDANFFGGRFLWGNSMRIAQYLAYLTALFCVLGAIAAFIRQNIFGKITSIAIICSTILLMIVQPSQYIPFIDMNRKHLVIGFSIIQLVGASLLFYSLKTTKVTSREIGK